MSLVPIIDIGPWSDGSPADRARLAAQIDDACRRVGFLELAGHGIPDAVRDAALRAADRFFGRPLTDKLRFVPPDPAINRGYAAAGSEALAYSLGVDSIPDLFESFNLGPDDVDYTDPWYGTQRHGFFAENIWPDHADDFRTAFVAWFAEARRVAQTLTRIFALALGLPVDHFAATTDRSTSTLRIVHYERRSAVPVREGQMRMGAHTDYGVCTVLYADSVPGLQIVGPDGAWHDVVPQPGNLLVNLGDLTAEWTNDRWRSTLHRVVPPPDDLAGPFLRRSFAFFYDGNYDALVSCLPTCCGPDNPPRYAPVTAGEHLMAKVLGPRTLRPSIATSTAGDRLPAS